MSRFSRPTRRSVSSPAVALFGDTRIPLAPPLPVRGAPEAAPVRSFTGTVTMPTEPKTQKPREFLQSEARKADKEADTRESAWRRGGRMYPDTEPNYAWQRGYAAGIRVALVALAPDTGDAPIV